MFEAELAGALSRYESTVIFVLETFDGGESVVKRVNAKSLIGMLSLELKGGETLTVSTYGADEKAAAEKVKELLTK